MFGSQYVPSEGSCHLLGGCPHGFRPGASWRAWHLLAVGLCGRLLVLPGVSPGDRLTERVEDSSTGKGLPHLQWREVDENEESDNANRC